MDFNTFIGAAWSDHASAPRAVADRLPHGIALIAEEAQLVRLAELAHHVQGAHLGDWAAATAFIAGLRALPVHADEGISGPAVRRYLASLALCADPLAAISGDASALSASDQIRVGAMAASNLVEHAPERSAALWRDAVTAAERSALPASDPVNRQLAVAGNNLACTLEDKIGRSAEERELMIFAAQTARRFWEIAGSWLEVERAEYRLSKTFLQAGDLAQARRHAQACIGIVAAHEGAALERLFGWEALALVERAAGDAGGHAQALARAREAFDQLDPTDQAGCASSIDKLGA